MKKILFAAIAMVLSLGVQAQNATNSPYSQYGYGRQSDQSNGAMKAMAGLSLGWREGNQVNFSNPASYSCVDSITFLFDAGISIQASNFTEGKHRLNANNSSFDYVIGAFRAHKHIGVAFGVMPYSSIGYSYYNSDKVDNSTILDESTTTFTNTYAGTGGLRQVFLGIGVEPLKLKGTSFSVGANASYLWGSYTKGIVNSYSNSYVKTLSKYYSCSVKAFKLDLGAQLQQRFGKNDVVTVGGTFSMKQKLHGDPKCVIISTDNQNSVSDTTSIVADGSHFIPMSYGAGFVWNHARKFRVGFDYEVEKWSQIQYPVYSVVDDKQYYTFKENMFSDRQKFTLGGEFCANELGRSWFGRIRYRAGVSYTTPYLKINGQEGPREIGASFGFGLPITNAYNNRSMLNISAQWVNVNAKNLIRENIFCINVGFTFNERWFAKWQLE